MPDHINNFWDWLLTGALAAWGLVVSLLITVDGWVKVLTLSLLVLKIIHEAIRFTRTLRGHEHG